MTTLIQRSFAAGELSPSLQSRVDTTKYATGLSAARNVYVRRDGGIDSRPGSRFIAEVKHSDLNTRLIPFVFSRDQTYLLEFGDEYIRFYKEGVQIKDLTLTITGVTNANPAVLSYTGPDPSDDEEFSLEDILGDIGNFLNGRNFIIDNVNSGANTFELKYLDGTPVDSTLFGSYVSGGSATRVYEIASPYGEADLDAIKFSQSYDVVTLVHPDYQIQELARIADDNWTLTGVVNAPDIASPTGISVAGIGVGTAEVDYFVTAVSRATLEESPLSTPGIPTIGSDASTGAPHTITWSAVAGATSYNVYKWVNGIYGFIGSAGANLQFINPGIPPDTTLTPPRAGDPFFPGFLTPDILPSAVGSFQQRQVYGGTNEQPNGVWMSRTARPKNFTNTEPLSDDDAIDFRIAGLQLNQIKHFVDIGKLIVFTTAGEWAVEGAGGSAITPTSLSVTQQSYHGSSDVRPLVADAMVLFIQARGAIVRDLTFSFQVDGYQGNDLTVFSSHLVRNHTIDDWAYQQTPHSVVWSIRDDGTMLSLTYVREQAIIGWCRHDTLGEFKKTCSLPEGLEDVLYVIAEREVDGRTVKYIEQFQTRVIDDIVDFIGMDCSLSYDGRLPVNTTMTLSGGTDWDYEETLTLTAGASYFVSSDVGKYIFLYDSSGELIRFEITGYTGAAVVSGKPNRTVPVSLRNTAASTWSKAITVVRGLWHLEGRDVSVFADGFVQGSPNNPAYTTKTVTDGAITLDSPAAVIHVGLPYVSDIETLDIDSPNGETLSDKKKLINQVTARVEDSRGIWAGPEAPEDDGIEGLVELKVRDSESMDHPVALSTGNIEIKIESHWSEGGHVFLRQVDPIPLTVLSIAPTGLIPFQGVR